MQKYNLRDGYNLKLQISNLKESIAEMSVNLESLSSVRMKERIQGGENSPDKAIIDKLSKLSELEEKLEELVELQLQMAEDIGKMSSRIERIILQYRYICNFTWESISERTGYSERQIFRIHERAVKNFEKIFLGCH